MKLALVYCPFFTNGDYPPLGLACINGALRQDGHETVCFDFCWLAREKFEEEFHLIREFFAIGRTKDEVVFALAPELGLHLVFGEDDKKFKWRLPYEGEFKAAGIALCLSLWNLVPKWADAIIAQEPEAVLFSTYSSNFFLSLYLAKHVKRLKPDLPIVFGGPGGSLPELQEFALAAGFVDALATGEGELTVQALCQDLPTALAKGIEGLAVRSNGSVICRPRPLAKDLDSLPRADFRGLPFPGFEFRAYQTKAKVLDLARSGFPVYSSRGCVNNCAYCSESAYWKKFRQRKPQNVIDEIRDIHIRYGETKFPFNDSALNGRPEWLEELCDRMQGLGFSATFWSYLIPNPSLNTQLASKMFKAGFRYATLGVETFSTSIRKRIYKGTTGDEIFAAMLVMTRAGINVTANVLAGFPGETRDEFEESIRYMKQWVSLKESERGPGKLFFEAGHRVRLEAYSRFYQTPEKYGIKIFPYEIPLPEKLSHLKQPLSRMLLRWSAGLDEKSFEQRSNRMKKIAIQSLES